MDAGKRRRYLVIGAVVAMVLLVAAVVVSNIVQNRNEDAPLVAVRSYVDAIARGDATAANNAVDPHALGEVDLALLSDQMLASARQRIKVEDVVFGFDADPASGTAEVEVSYSLGNARSTVVLRAQRTDSSGVFDEWRVIDPLLARVQVETNEPTLDTARLGTARVPVGGPHLSGFPQRPVLVYPAIYELQGDESQYLTADPKPVVAQNLDHSMQPTNTGKPVEATVVYKATPALTAAVTTQLVDHLNACVAAATPDQLKGCPIEMFGRSENSEYRLDKPPVVNKIIAYNVEYKADGSTEPPMRFTAEDGRVHYQQQNGKGKTDTFLAYGRIVVTPDDKLTITFTSAL